MAENFNDTWIKRLPAAPDGKRMEYTDGACRGLKLRVTDKGVKSFSYLHHDPDGKVTRKTIGRYPDVSLAKARDKARNYHTQRADGRAPHDEDVGAVTVRQLAKDWYERSVLTDTRRKRPDKIKQLLDHDIVPALGSYLVLAVRHRDIVREVVDKMVKRGAKNQALRALGAVKLMFGWAASNGYIESNPAAGISTKDTVRYEYKPRNRVLTWDELREIFDYVPGGVHNYRHRIMDMLALILLTAQRGGEVRQLRWQDVADGVWTIPADFIKTKHHRDAAHIVHLSPQAQAVIDRQPKVSDWVFPGAELDLPLAPNYFGLRVMELRKKLTVDHWTAHDLRRSAASHMGEMGLPLHHIERILNHELKGILSVYQHAEWIEERKAAIYAWGEKVKEEIGGL